MSTSVLLRAARSMAVLLSVAPLAIASAASAEQNISQSIDIQNKSDKASAGTQARIAQLADETTELLGEYRLTIQQLDRVTIYNNHLQGLVNDQEAEKADMQSQLDNFTVVEQGIVPLMQNMIDDLETFIGLDVPFNLDERQNRVARLRNNMNQAEITISEKYRQIMEAYTIEVNFGRDIEAYTGKLETGGQSREVDFFRVGRILLAYQTKDKTETGFWNKTSGDWEILPDEYRNFITEGLRIARKQAPPNLLMLPVPGPTPAQ
jgi:hypothetical protein